jgi:hypothetical protein
MGGSSSKSSTTNKYNTTVVNKSDLELLNKNVNNFVANTVVNQASNCSASISQLQNVNFSHISTPGDFTVDGVNQSQKAAITFDCIQLSAFKNDIANGVLTQYMDAIKNSYDTSSIAKMTAAAQSKAQDQFAGTGTAKSSSDANNEYNFNSKTEVNQKIQNIVENSITNNMSLNDMQDCMASVKNSQSINFSDINAGGNFTVRAISQTQAADLYAKCVQEKNNGNKISNQIATDLGLEITTEAKTTSSAEMAGTSAAESLNVGALQSAGDGLASAFKGLGSMWGSIFGSLGFGDPTISLYCCIAIIVLAVIGGAGFYLYKRSQNEDSSSDSSGDDLDQMGGQLVKFDALKFLILIITFVLIIQIYQKEN